jgi:hypothetical protein
LFLPAGVEGDAGDVSYAALRAGHRDVGFSIQSRAQGQVVGVVPAGLRQVVGVVPAGLRQG